MRSLEELEKHIPKCIGYDSQGIWSSVNPINNNDFFGFIYALRVLDTYYYIGSKQFQSERKLLRSGKKKKVIQESDWKNYKSSSKVVKDILLECGDDACEYYHLHSWKSKKTLKTAEQLTINNMDFITRPAIEHPENRMFLNGWSDKIFACNREEDLQELRAVFG